MEVGSEYNWDTKTECARRVPSSGELKQHQLKVFGAEEL